MIVEIITALLVYTMNFFMSRTIFLDGNHPAEVSRSPFTGNRRVAMDGQTA